jgi:hypothetical protein
MRTNKVGRRLGPNFESGNEPCGAITTDVNNDGKPDIVLLNYTSGDAVVLTNRSPR